MACDVFISYSHHNKPAADAVCHSLEQNHIRCWYAPRDISPSDIWAEAIVTAIESAKIMVVLVTKESIPSKQVLNEISIAVSAGVDILPFRLTGEELSKGMYYYLNAVHWLDAVDRPLEESILELKAKVSQLLGIASQPAQQPARKPAPQPARKTATQPVRKPVQPPARKTAQQPVRKPAPQPQSKPRPRAVTLQAPQRPGVSWEQIKSPKHVAISVQENVISWGMLRDGGLISKTVTLPDAVLANIPAGKKIPSLVGYVLSYIRDHNGCVPSVCTVAVPYKTCRETAQVTSVGKAYNTYIRSHKCVSAAAVGLSRLISDKSSYQVLVVEYNGASCETLIADIGDGLVEIGAAVQRQIRPDLPLTFDLLRNDIYKVIDAVIPEWKVFGKIAVSASLPEDWIRQLEDLFHIPCLRMGPDVVLYGLGLQCGVLSGEVKDLLLLDAVDYEISVDSTVIIQDGTVFPARNTEEISYHTARADHCMDVYLKKNNMVRDTPLHFRLDISAVLDPGKPVQKLEVTAQIDNNEYLRFTVRNPASGKSVVCEWDRLCKQFG